MEWSAAANGGVSFCASPVVVIQPENQISVGVFFSLLAAITIITIIVLIIAIVVLFLCLTPCSKHGNATATVDQTTKDDVFDSNINSTLMPPALKRVSSDWVSRSAAGSKDPVSVAYIRIDEPPEGFFFVIHVVP